MSDHDHDHHHEHSEQALRAEALESLLIEKGLVRADEIDAVVARYENDIGPLRGAQVVARAWVDADFRARLFEDATEAIKALGIDDVEGKHLVALENTPDVHNVVVCTLCSCYPWAVLGLPPTWYKEPSYRSRVVREPRAVLSEFGLEIEPEVDVRVWDSTAEVRYLVVPERPAGTEDLTEAQLAALVVRDSMIGTARAAVPA